MGFAILIVMLFHMGVPRSSSWYGLARMGNLGVDIFLFLSGMGLWYSWSKNPALRQFYFNRVIRIYPAWLIIAGYYFISRFDFAHATVDSWINLVMQVLFNWNFWRFDQLTCDKGRQFIIGQGSGANQSVIFFLADQSFFF